MILNCSLCSDDIKQILSEEKDMLDIRFDSKGLCLTTVYIEDKGFYILKRASDITVKYHTKTDFCRALLTICSREGEESWIYSEKSSFDEFGIMLDFSRNAVMQVQTVKKFIRTVAPMGYNYIGLYMEDTIKVPEEPYFGYMRGSMTAEQLKEIDDYASIFGMEIRAYIQTLAHFNQITRYEEYQEIIDTNDILLAGEERTYQLVENLIKAVSENISSRKINIGMDEAHLIGLGKYLDKHGYSNRFKIMEDHLSRVLNICRKYGLQVQMWSDMFFRLAYGGEYYITDEKEAVLPNIPSDVELVYWDYYHFEKEHYDKMLKKHFKLTDQVGFAGGAWKWMGITPHNTYSMTIGKVALAACKENNVKSVVITAWADNGAEASSFSILPALYADAEYNYSEDFDKSKFYYLTGMAFDDFMQIDLPSHFTKDIDKHSNASKFLLYDDAFLSIFDSAVFDGISDYYMDTAARLKRCCDNKNFGYLFDTQLKLCEVLQYKADLGRRIKTYYDQKDMKQLSRIVEIEIPLILEKLQDFYQAFEIQWGKENKPFGFEVQCIRIGGLEKRLTYIKNQLKAYGSGVVDRIEELEVTRREFHYYNEEDNNNLNWNLWHDIVSPADMG